MKLIPDDWASVFRPETAPVELIARGSALYFGILVLMRFMPRRTGGELATMDLVFVVLIANAASHALGDYTSVADGILLITTLMGWNYLVNALSYRVPLVEWLVSSPPLQVVRDGQLLRRNMRREFITEAELMSHLRQQGIDDVKDVKAAYVEGEGKITAVSRKGTM
jgi:uncharacterized membrane protein YcaP (DUF421 family)